MPGDVVAGIGRQWRHPFVDAAADQLVRLADAEGLRTDQDVPLAQGRRWNLGVVERLRAPRTMYQYDLHANAAPQFQLQFLYFRKYSPLRKLLQQDSASDRVSLVARESMTTTAP